MRLFLLLTALLAPRFSWAVGGGAIVQSGIGNGTVTTAKLGDGSVTTSKLGVDLAFTGSANFDAGTLYVDPANNRVGVGTTSPATLLHMSSGTQTIDGTNNGLTIGTTLQVTNAQLQLGTVNQSQAVPDLAWIGDTNTGIYWSSADTFNFTNGGAQSVRVDANGTVGIGGNPTGGAGMSLELFEQAGFYSRTKAQIDTLTPGKAGAAIFCSDCATSGDVCVGTGPLVAQWRRIGTAAGCGTNE